MSGWDFESAGGESTVNFTKFAEGITEIRVIEDTPHVRWTHWMTKHNKSVNCPGMNSGCPICEIRKQQKAAGEPYTYNVSRRFALQVLNKGTNKLEIMEQGITFFEDLKDVRAMLAEDNLSFEDATLKVRRRGMGQTDTTYRIDIGDKVAMTPEEANLVEDKLDLVEYFKPNTVEEIQRLIDGESWEDVMYQDEEEEFELE